MSVSSPTPAAWTACLSVFERELTPQQFATWIRPLAVEPGEGSLRLRAPNRFVLQWVKDRFGSRIAAVAREAAGVPLAIEYSVADPASAPAVSAIDAIIETAPPDDEVSSDDPSPAPEIAPAPQRTRPASVVPRRIEPTSLNGTFTFDSFVTGKANQLARA
nr:chromosomal replication initiator protein DnaA [Burkholderiales bacterium]